MVRSMVRRAFVGFIALLFILSPLGGFVSAGVPVSNCCDFANSTSADVAALSLLTEDDLGGTISPAKLGQLLKALGKTQEVLGQGVTEGSDTCDGKKARQKFQYAKGFLHNYREILDSLGLGGGFLDNLAASLEGSIDNLIAGVCDDCSGSGSGT